MKKSDLEEVAIIETQIFETPWSYESFKQILESKFNHYFVLEKENALIGYFGIQIIIDEAQIHNIGILKEHRGKGHGNGIFEFIMKHCDKHKVDNITLEVRQTNTNAIGLYEKYGFEKMAVIKNYYTNPVEDGFLMRLDLGEK